MDYNAALPISGPCPIAFVADLLRSRRLLRVQRPRLPSTVTHWQRSRNTVCCLFDAQLILVFFGPELGAQDRGIEVDAGFAEHRFKINKHVL